VATAMISAQKADFRLEFPWLLAASDWLEGFCPHDLRSVSDMAIFRQLSTRPAQFLSQPLSLLHPRVSQR
jgi:hypothetical protein